MPLTLERIKQRERLSFIETYELESDIPTQFKSCPFLDSPQICEQASDDNVVISAAITDGNKAIAFLIETKDLGGLASDQILLIIEVVIVLASALFIFLFVGVSKITSVEVPAALADLIEWIKSDSVERPNLKFSEFNILADQIAKVVLERQRINSQVIFPPFVGHD